MALASTDDQIRSLKVQTDQKLVAMGVSKVGGNYQYGYARPNSDGTINAGFNGTGMLTLNLQATDDEGYSGAVQPDGKIFFGGLQFGSAHSRIGRSSVGGGGFRWGV